MRLLPDSRVARFGLIGGLNTVFGFAVFSALALTGWADWVAILGGNLAGMVFNFVTTGGLVFRQLDLKRLPRFVISYCALLGMNLLGLQWLEPIVHGKLIAQACVTIPLAIVSYLLMSRWVFPDTDESDNGRFPGSAK